MTYNTIFEKIKTLDLQKRDIKWQYSSSQYVFLSYIIEAVSGISFEKFFHDNIFTRFNMKNAFLSSELPLRESYTKQYSSWPIYKEEIWPSLIELKGEGGVWMSLNDYEKWIEAFDSNKIFHKKQTMEKFLSYGKFDN